MVAENTLSGTKFSSSSSIIIDLLLITVWKLLNEFFILTTEELLDDVSDYSYLTVRGLLTLIIILIIYS